jgi:hypothetical protein
VSPIPEKKEVPLSGIFIFCYGSNHPVSMSKLFGFSLEEYLSRCISCSAPGWGRVFVGISPSWGNASFANLLQHPKSEVEGYAVKLTPEEVKKLDG